MKKRVLFIDRDGTLIVEPPVTFQIDGFEKLKFLPGVISQLSKIAAAGRFELVMVTNQDGLGTSSFPEETFWPTHHLMLDIFKGEGVVFSEVCIDRSFADNPLPTRKPGTAMLTKYFSDEYDLANSYVIGDRITDVMLAKNLGSKSIFICNYDEPGEWFDKIDLVASDWQTISNYLLSDDRRIEHQRITNETSIRVVFNPDGRGRCSISTGLNFFDHMLEQIGKHSGSDLIIEAKGDLHIDEHHTIEDTAITFGEAVALALGDKKGIARYGFCLPMDDCLVQVAIDFGGRPWLEWDAEFKREKVGDMPTEMFYHFFKSFADAAKCNLNIKAEGDNEHHKIEAIFKALAKAIGMAVARNTDKLILPSTKGKL
jgi:imidazoleglycerol-phosphate dehydratase/histidinol-phosphatase